MEIYSIQDSKAKFNSTIITSQFSDFIQLLELPAKWRVNFIMIYLLSFTLFNIDIYFSPSLATHTKKKHNFDAIWSLRLELIIAFSSSLCNVQYFEYARKPFPEVFVPVKIFYLPFSTSLT